MKWREEQSLGISEISDGLYLMNESSKNMFPVGSVYRPYFPSPLPLSSELPENWTDTRETILEGMTFNLRHLGMTLVDQPRGEDLSAAAVKRIVATVRAAFTVTEPTSPSIDNGKNIS